MTVANGLDRAPSLPRQQPCGWIPAGPVVRVRSVRPASPWLAGSTVRLPCEPRDPPPCGRIQVEVVPQETARRDKPLQRLPVTVHKPCFILQATQTFHRQAYRGGGHFTFSRKGADEFG